MIDRSMDTNRTFIVRIIKCIEHCFYWCEGCKEAHSVPTERWKWDRNVTFPTLDPSVRHFYLATEYSPEKTLCHYYIKAGVIEYCNDCIHELSNKKIPLEEIPLGYNIPENDKSI